MVQSIVHHSISCRCSSHMVLVSDIRWWRISMTMAHTSLVYVECFRNLCRWQNCKRSWCSVFVNLTLSCPFLSSVSGSLILCAPCNMHLSKWFSSTYSMHQSSHTNNIGRNVFCCCDYYIASIPVCSSLLPISNVMFHQQWNMINLRDALQWSRW